MTQKTINTFKALLKRTFIFTYYRKLKMFLYWSGIKKKQGTLFYIGLHKGNSFYNIFYKYKVCYGFEPIPELYEHLIKVYKKYPYVKIYNKAVYEKEGTIPFNISSNVCSSSIGTFKKEWKDAINLDITMTTTISVSSINLMNFINEHKIDFIDDYISDIQGFDLCVLKTIKPMIENKKIKAITCEISNDKYGNSYEGAPDNSFSGFKRLLQKNYNCFGIGSGILKDGHFYDIPESHWEFDAKWKLKE